MSDIIYLRSLATRCIFESDAWGRQNKLEPVILSLSLAMDTRSAAIDDDLDKTFSYGTMCKEVVTHVEGRSFLNICQLLLSILQLAKDWPGTELRISARAPKSLLRCEGGMSVELVATRLPTWQIKGTDCFVEKLRIPCVIGVNQHERDEKQDVVIDLKFSTEGLPLESQCDHRVWRHVVSCVREEVENSTFSTLEAMADLIAKTCLEKIDMPQVTVRVEKPSALTFVEGAGIEITRYRSSLRGIDGAQAD